MIIVLKPGVNQDEIDHIVEKIEKLGLKAHVSSGEQQTVIGAIGDESVLLEQPIESISGVEKVVPIVKPYKVASRDFHPDDTIINQGNLKLFKDSVFVFAGPCTIESREQTDAIADLVGPAGANGLRGGAYKPRTSPYSFQGLGKVGLEILRKAGSRNNLPIVSEVMDPRNVGIVSEFVDVIQIGARNMQNFDLLKEVGQQDRPILLKRGMASTINEFLMSAEYIMSQGNENIMLCERGIRTFETSVRSSLDISSIAVLKRESHLPVFVDPSHAAGNWRYIESLSLAAVAAGVDGLIIEVHNEPEKAMVDGAQSLLPDRFAKLVVKIKGIKNAMNELEK